MTAAPSQHLGADTTDDASRDTGTGAGGSVGTPHFVLAVLALALGGFAIGTTEFVTMGLIREIAGGVEVSIPSAGHVISAIITAALMPSLSSGRCVTRYPSACS